MRPRIAYGDRNTILFMASLFLHGVSSAIYSLWFNLHLLALGLPKGLLGVLNALPSALALAMGLPAGRWMESIGRRRMMAVGGMGMALGTLLVGLGTSPLSIGMGVVWIGIGYNLFMIPQAPFLMENAPPERRTALFALASALLFWAGFLGEWIGGLLPDGLQRILPLGPTPYAGPILFTALLDFLALLPLLGIRERPRPAAAAALPPAPSLSISPLSLALPHLLLGIGAGLSLPFLNVYFRERYGMPDEALGALFAAASALTGLGALLAPPLARRWGRIPTVALTQGLSVLALIGMALTEQAGLAALAMLLRSILMNMGAPLYTEFCMATLPPREPGIASGLLNAAWEAGWMLGAAASGFLQDRFGSMVPVFLITAFFYGISTLYQYLAFAPRERALPIPHPSSI